MTPDVNGTVNVNYLDELYQNVSLYMNMKRFYGGPSPRCNWHIMKKHSC